MNAADQQYLIEVISQLKLAQQNQEQAQKDLELWIKRMELAKQARDRELWEAAREKALEAEEKVRKAESVVMELEVERDNFKRKAAEPRPDPGLVQAHHLMEQFKALGVDPDAAKLREVERGAGADLALEALKRKLGG
jgi:hypothetical protein